jgi:hypothetical protein
MVKSILLKVDEDKFEELSKMKGDLSWEKFFLESQNKDWNALHTNIHAVRLIKGYKPSEMELRLGAIIVERFKNTCDECKKVSERVKTQSTETKKNSFWQNLIET